VPFVARRVPALSVSAKVTQQQCNRPKCLVLDRLADAFLATQLSHAGCQMLHRVTKIFTATSYQALFVPNFLPSVLEIAKTSRNPRTLRMKIGLVSDTHLPRFGKDLPAVNFAPDPQRAASGTTRSVHSTCSTPFRLSARYPPYSSCESTVRLAVARCLAQDAIGQVSYRAAPGNFRPARIVGLMSTSRAIGLFHDRFAHPAICRAARGYALP
jgi:hypothetical protein